MRTENVEIVVVGGGSAAFEAAVAAKQAGAPKVVMFEKAPEPEFGGNARFSHTGFRWVFSGADEIRQFLPDIDDATFAKLHLPAYTAEQFHADLQRVTRGRISKELSEVLVSQSNPAIHWMREVGIKWDIDSHDLPVHLKIVVVTGGQCHRQRHDFRSRRRFAENRRNDIAARREVASRAEYFLTLVRQKKIDKQTGRGWMRRSLDDREPKGKADDRLGGDPVDRCPIFFQSIYAVGERHHGYGPLAGSDHRLDQRVTGSELNILGGELA